MQGLTSHSTHNNSFRRQVFPGNRLHWYWQPKTMKHNTTYTLNTKEKQKKTTLTNKTIYSLVGCPLWPSVRKRSGLYSYSPRGALQNRWEQTRRLLVTWVLRSSIGMEWLLKMMVRYTAQHVMVTECICGANHEGNPISRRQVTQNFCRFFNWLTVHSFRYKVWGHCPRTRLHLHAKFQLWAFCNFWEIMCTKIVLSPINPSSHTAN